MISAVKFIGLLLCLGLMASCSSQIELEWNEKEGYRWAELSPGYFADMGFKKLDPSRTNVSFKNHLSEERIAENRNLLNGSGVAAGDIDGDGLADLYFAQLEGPNKMYKNMGNLQFKDITEQAGVAHEGFNSIGVVFADVNGDSHLDLLVTSLRKENVLYINDGEGHFGLKKDSGLGQSKGSTTMALADIDGDADLDLYLTNYKRRSVRDIYSSEKLNSDDIVKTEDDTLEIIPPFDEHYGIIQTEGGRYINEYGKSDELYINNGEGYFEKVHEDEKHFLDENGKEKGLAPDWGLAAKFQDLNGDRLPDLYVCNDFWTPDRIWINQGNGKFKAIDEYAFRNYSFSSMAVDFSDINRDGSPDIFITEMLSFEHQKRMRQLSEHLEAIKHRPQYNRNSLYLNHGDNTFAEIAYLSGLEATGWSWAINFMDIDLDGYEDLIITTGNAYDVQNIDTQLNRGQTRQSGYSKGALLEHPSLEIRNKIFQNNQDLTFSDKSLEWGFEEQDVSHGMALADLDNDGDLDFALNRMNQVASLYENETTAARIAVRLNGNDPNVQAIGAKITLKGGPVIQTKELASGGNYISGSDPLVVFAADENNQNHQLIVTWPEHAEKKQTKIDSVQANRIYEINEPDMSYKVDVDVSQKNDGYEEPIFEDISDKIDHYHHENDFNDFRIQPLLPQKLSQQGPGITWLDFDQDGDDDLFIASGKGGKPGLFENIGEGEFQPAKISALDNQVPGDQTTILGWTEKGYTQLIVGSENYEQGNATKPSAFQYQLNQNTSAKTDSIPGIHSNTGPLAAADYDGDEDVDLFVGGRFKPLNYPKDATSRLLKNKDGDFQPDQINLSKMNEIGLVTGAVFTDFDQDGDQDLLLSREWDSILLFENKGGTFQNISSEVGLDTYKGWWNGIATGDFNNDGLPDIIATNIGRNSPYQLSSQFPLKMYYEDFDGNGRLDILETYHDPVVGGYVPRRHLYELESIPTVLRYINSHSEFANASIEKLFGRDFSKVSSKEINTVDHMLFLNRGNHFTAHPLPVEAQFGAAFYAGTADYNNDGNEDIFISQNSFAFPPHVPRQDAGRGLWLQGDGEGNFKTVSGNKTGIKVYEEQRGAAMSDFNKDGRVDLAVSQNGDTTKLFKNKNKKEGFRIRLVGPYLNKDAIGSSVRLVYEDGSKGPRREIQAGSGYWSQNSMTQVLGNVGSPIKIEIFWFDATTETVEIIDDKKEYKINY